VFSALLVLSDASSFFCLSARFMLLGSFFTWVYFLLEPFFCCLLKFGDEVDGRIEGIVAGLSRLMMGIPKKEKKRGVLSASFRPESSSPGRAISYPWRAIFRGCIVQGRKTAKESKNRIENRSHHYYHGQASSQ
jgi:hypothetical protein